MAIKNIVSSNFETVRRSSIVKSVFDSRISGVFSRGILEIYHPGRSPNKLNKTP